jgi:hypothetical protein
MIKTIETNKKVLQTEDLEHCVQGRANVQKHTQTHTHTHIHRMSYIPSSNKYTLLLLELKNTIKPRKINNYV